MMDRMVLSTYAATCRVCSGEASLRIVSSWPTIVTFTELRLSLIAQSLRARVVVSKTEAAPRPDWFARLQRRAAASDLRFRVPPPPGAHARSGHQARWRLRAS